MAETKKDQYSDLFVYRLHINVPGNFKRFGGTKIKECKPMVFQKTYTQSNGLMFHFVAIYTHERGDRCGMLHLASFLEECALSVKGVVAFSCKRGVG